MTRALAAFATLWVAVVTTFASGVEAAPSGADAPSAADERRATELFEQGREAMTAEDYDTACAKFAESQRLLPARGTQLNLAVCQESVGRLAEALENVREVLDQLPPDDERHGFAKEKMESLDDRVPELTLERSKELPSEATVVHEGVDLDVTELGEPLRVDPGEHVVEVRVSGHEDRRYHVSIGEGESKSLTLEAGPATEANESPDPDVTGDEEEGASLVFVSGVALGSLGAAGVIIGAITGGLAIGKKDVVDEECGPEVCATQRGVDAADAGATLSAASTVSFVVGGVALAAGVALVVVDGSAGDDEAVALTPIGYEGGAGIGVLGRF